MNWDLNWERFCNWLEAKPWRWHYRKIYRTFRYPTGDDPMLSRRLAAWYALTFPHVHHEGEEAVAERDEALSALDALVNLEPGSDQRARDLLGLLELQVRRARSKR